MKIFATGFLLLFLHLSSIAQPTITGKVVNAESGASVGGASVFINNTSRGTVSDSKGEFTLNDVPPGKHELVISSVGYETLAYPFSEAQLPLHLRIELKIKVQEMQGVTVAPYEVDGWKKWGRVFTENFIGLTPNAQQCKILNSESIKFRFSKKENKLTAVCFEPLRIENKALGYILQYQLEKFEINFSEHSSIYLGYPFFEEMQTDRKNLKEKWEERRQKAYNGSMMHFIRSLYTNRVKENGFEVRRLKKIPNIEKQRVREVYRNGRPSNDSAEYYRSVLRQTDEFDIFGKDLLGTDSLVGIDSSGDHLFFFPDYLYITFKNEKEDRAYLDFTHENRQPFYQRSSLLLVSGYALSIEANGNYFDPQDLYSLGYWSWSEKMADFLPLDYEPQRTH